MNVDTEEQAQRDSVDQLVLKARIAQQQFEKDSSQSRYDQAALAAAWALMEPSRNEALSKFAVAETGLGNVADKMTKNRRKTLGLLRDIQHVRTTGIIEDDPATGITKIARPIGVIGAVVPSTNPAATPANNMINALKCGNAIVLSPSPKGAAVCEQLLKYVHEEFEKTGIDPNLVQMVPHPSSKIKTQRLMEATDLIIVTGSQDNVRRAYSSGSPAIGVGAGNATVLVDETADLSSAAAKIAASKTFDNATSCSSENALVILDEVFDDFIEAAKAEGGRLLGAEDRDRLKAALFQSGNLNRHMIAKDIDQFLEVAGLTVADPDTARFVMFEAEGIGPDHPESGEKLSLALSIYRAKDFNDATTIASRILAHQGAGHSIGLHSTDDGRALQLGSTMPTCRVIVNQAHCFATGGSFDNGLPFSLSMGCGSWGGNSIDSNLNYQHFMNTTRVVRPIPTREPKMEDLFTSYWKLAGK